MSNNFLQRFKGKTQQISKDGVNDILGSKKPDAQYNPNQAPKSKPVQKKSIEKPQKPTKKANQNKTANEQSKKNENPFLVSNPFYLDEEERQREEIRRRQEQRLEEEMKKAQKAEKEKDQKELTRTSAITRSLEKKKATDKGWSKLGGLGANIGGDQWLQKRKKLQKIQEFSGQVKNSNAERIKPPKPEKKEEPKQPNSRQKMLEYSKNVPKPVIKKQEYEEEEERKSSKKLEEEEGLTELQLYEMKHEQLKKMLNNKY